MNAKSLFISRRLAPNSPLLQLRQRLRLVDESLINFKPVAFTNIPKSEWIFFYSQRAVEYFLNGHSTSVSQNTRLAAFGPKTASVLTIRDRQPSFIGTGKARETAQAFSMLCRAEKVLFPRARTSMRSVQKLLPDHIRQFDLIVYDNISRTDLSVPKCDILIFTSPLNAKTYFHKYNKEAGQIIFAIGATTAGTIKNLTGTAALVPENPSEAALAKLVERYI